MDQITKHSFSCHNSCSDDHDHNDHDHNDHNKLEHCCNHTYFYTSCNYLFRAVSRPAKRPAGQMAGRPAACCVKRVLPLRMCGEHA
jgi:hypothetical protein